MADAAVDEVMDSADTRRVKDEQMNQHAEDLLLCPSLAEWLDSLQGCAVAFVWEHAVCITRGSVETSDVSAAGTLPGTLG